MEKHITPASLSLLLLCLLSVPQQSCQQSYARPTVTPHVSVSENAAIGDVINTIRDDAPNGPGKIATVVYRGSNQDFYATKIPHQPVWNVTLNRTLDYETQTWIEVVFEAQGARGQNVESTDARFILHVLDENDNAPQFQHLPCSAEVDEDAPLGTSVNISILATDVDTGAGGQVTYQLVASSKEDAAMFLMDPAHGHITLNGSLDYENGKILYHYRVLARDRGSPALSSSTDLFITVRDIQDSPPLFVNIPYVASLPENSHLMTSVLTVRAVDQDRAIPNPVTYNVTHSTCPGLFEVDAHSGVISVSGPLDTDTAPLKDLSGLCTIQLQATEENWRASSQKGNFTASATANIHVVDLNDNGPRFSQASFSASIPENWPAGSPLQLDIGQQMMVSDKDQGSNSVIQLSLVTENDTFELTTPRVQSNGPVQLRVRNNTRLDYEQVQTLTVKIQARDTVPSQHRPVTATVTVAVTNMNEFSPQLTQSAYTASVPEGSPPGTPVTSVHATDGDAGIYGEIKYSLNNARGLFTIDKQTGQVSVASNHTDREREDRYYLMVVATDGGGLQQTAPLTLHISDVNDHAPLFLRHQYDVILTENSAVFSQDVTVQALDADGTEQNRGVQYSLSTSSQWSSHFLVNASTGLLQLTTPLDSETLGQQDGVIPLVVLATDQGHPPLTGSVTVTVTVQDINDMAPVFSSLHYEANITENQSPGEVLTQVQATDGDQSSPNNQVFYVLAGGGNDQFQVNSTSGVICTVTSLDREQLADYNLTVLAIDRGSPAFTVTTTVSVVVNNINDDPPRFLAPQQTVAFMETRNVGVTVATCRAVDGDADAALKYSLLWSQSSGLDDQQQPVSTEVLKNNFALLGNRVVTNFRHGLDREAVDSATLYVQVIDSKAAPGTQQTATCTVSVQVEDRDDNPPTFSGQSFSANLTENSPHGTPLQFDMPIDVTDLDKNENGAFALSLSNYTHCLEVLPSRARSEATVLIRVTDSTCFDYERDTVADFEVVAKGLGNGNFTANVSVRVNIININDETPKFTAASYNVSVPENLNVSSSIITVMATDADQPPYDAISYSLQGGDGVFSINGTTGEVEVLQAQLDYETRQQYQLRVEARDIGGLRDSVSLTVTLTDLNDNRPQFVRPQYQAFVLENQPHFDRERELEITATDSDSGVNKEITYSISNSSQLPANFTINAATGQLSILQGSGGLDYEALPDRDSGVVHLVVVACDAGTPSLCSNVSVLVTVRDENDNWPVFEQSYHGNISETAALDTSLLTVKATDSDGHAPNNKVFYVMSGTGSDKFKVDSSSGLVSRAGQLDSDTTSFYNLTLTAIDGGSPAKSSSTFVTVDVLDVNDVAPEFSPRSKSVDVAESDGLRPGDPSRVLATLWATDPDLDSRLCYEVEWSRSRGFGPNQERVNVSVLQEVFEVNGSSGEVKVRGNRLDRETLSRVLLVVNVTDLNAIGAPQNSTGNLTINVVDVNDHKPRFNRASYTAHIAENAVKDSVLQIVSADHMTVTDLDTDQNCVFSIWVEGADSAYFTAEPSTARSFALVQLRVRNGSILDYEQRHNISFNVTVRETSTEEHFTNTVTVIVNITDVNDNWPTFSGNYSAEVQENSPPGTNITTVQASDKDSGTFSEITYSLEGDAARFVINATTGQVSTADGSLDRESRDTYLMTVVATDGGGRRSGTPLTITVTDANDEAPFFPANYSSKVPENSVALRPPVTLLAEDRDLPGSPNSRVTYHLHSCDPVPCPDFTLDKTTGQLTLTTELDFERTRSVELVVTARDQGSRTRLTGTATVVIDVEDMNDVDPVFTTQLYNASINENSEEGTYVGTVSATDGDGTSPNKDVFYVLDSGRGADKFRVNSSSGVVTVGPGAQLDRESDDDFHLKMLALDRGDPPRSSSAVFAVSLRDINDEVPVFSKEGKSGRVREDAEEGEVVEVMTATDPDEDSALEYSWVLEESWAATDRDVRVDISLVSPWFRVNASTGEVTVHSELDRELAEVIVLKIRVNDTTGVLHLPQTALATLTVTLTDVNDNRPVVSGSQRLRVSEALAVGTEVATYTASDADRDQTVTFSVLSEGQAFFSISPAGKLSLQRQIDRETTPTVQFTLIATDSGQPPLSSNVSITVTVLDANDNDPQFQNTSYVFSVAEDAPEDTLVVTINATDRDQGPNANVTFDFADYVLDFVLNKTTGELRVHKALDRETQPRYSFGVAALDNPTTDVKRRTVQQVTITITDVNDHAPQFLNLGPGDDGYTAQIDETKRPGDKVLSMHPGPVQATDQDEGSNAALSFHLLSQSGVEYFRMDAGTGEVFVNGSIQGRAGVYRYVMTVADGGQPSLNTSTNLTIEVLDQNLNDPQFISDYANIKPIPECSKIGTTIQQFVATDSDRNKKTNGKVQYFFDNSTSSPGDLSYFSLHPDTGELVSARLFDRESQAVYQIGVIAQDEGVPNVRYSKPLRITIHIFDGNDNGPEFNITHYRFTVPESQDQVVVGQVYAQDADEYKRTCYTLVGDHTDYFNISTRIDVPADLLLVKALDRENDQQASFSLEVTASDCTDSAGSCDSKNFPLVSATVHITVSDVNDHAPNFTRPHLNFGLTSTADAGHVIANLQDYVEDPDLGSNRVHGFYPVGQYQMDPQLTDSLKTSPSAHPLSLSVNGSLSTRSVLPGDAEGFFTWTIMANDSAGQDTVVVKIYVVGKDKLIKISFFTSVEELRHKQDDILRDLSAKTGMKFVSDDREPFEDHSGIDSSKSVLVVHAVDQKENAMDANSLMDFLDHQVDATDFLKTHYKLYNIETYKKAESNALGDLKKMEYILGAIICVLVIAFFVTLYLMLNNIRRFKRKLKAARIETYPMTRERMAQAVPGLKTPQTNPIFGKEEDLATQETETDRESHHSDVSLDTFSVMKEALAGHNTLGLAEEEVTMDLYGEDAADHCPVVKDNTFYLDQALAEHDRLKNGLPGGRRLGPKPSSVNGQLPNGGHSEAPTVDFDLDECESTDI